MLPAKDKMDLCGLENAVARTKNTIQQSSQKHASQSGSRLLTLPPELRLQIYEHVADFKVGNSKVEQQGGRSRFRIDWTAKALPDNAAVRNVASLMAVCRKTREELLPMFLRAYIVKFPSWDPGFKLQCLYWIDLASEAFVNNIDFIWFEGVYWRFSICLGKTQVDEKEDGKATREDCHRYHKEESMAFSEGDVKFFLKVEYVRQEQMWQAAGAACRKTFDVLMELLTERGESRLGKVEMTRLIQEIPLTGSDQLRVLTWKNYGVNASF